MRGPRARAASRALAAAATLLLAGGAGAAASRPAAASNSPATRAAPVTALPPSLPTDLAAPLPANLLAAQDAVFHAASTVMAGKSLVCGAINALQSGYNLETDLGDGFFSLNTDATTSINAVLAVRGACGIAPLPRADAPPGRMDGVRLRRAPLSQLRLRTWTA